jgi:hypothetical protein
MWIIVWLICFWLFGPLVASAIVLCLFLACLVLNAAS